MWKSISVLAYEWEMMSLMITEAHNAKSKGELYGFNMDENSELINSLLIHF